LKNALHTDLFSFHKKSANRSGAKEYFAHPYYAWEHGFNENVTGFIRQ